MRSKERKENDKERMQKKDLFAGSSSCSSSANDSDDDVLAEQMAAAATRERCRDPHAYTPFDSTQKNKKQRGIAPIMPISKVNGNAMGNSESDGDSDSDEKSVTVFMKKKKDLEHANTKKKGNSKFNSDENNNNNNNNNNNKEEEEGDVGGIRINKEYAIKYEAVKRKKELQQLTVKYSGKLRVGEEEEEEEEEEDDGAVLLTEDKEMAFAKAFLAIRQAAAKVKKQQRRQNQEEKKSILRQGGSINESDGTDNATDASNTEDPLKAPTAVFFPSPDEQVRENTRVFEEAIAKKRQERKKFTLADEYRRGVVSEGAVEGEGEDDSHHPQGNRRIQPQSAKERELRDSFLKNTAESTETFDVQPAAPIQSQKGQEEASGNKESSAKRLLKGAFAIKDAEGSSSAEEDPNEAFLRDFFVEELWKPENNKKRKVPGKQGSSDINDGNNNDEEEGSDTSEEIGNNYALLAQLAQEEEDERFYADAEVWEREYQQRAYRHQEEAAEQVQSFPRPIGEHAAGLLRKSVVSARKEARQRRLQRMEEMRQQQVAELRRLKTLKRQEIEAQRALIASVAGIVKGSGKCGSNALGDTGERNKKGQDDGDEDNEDAEVKRLMALWSEKDLEEDFDPKKFDKKMASIFDDAYYDEENVDDEEMAFFEDEEDGTGEGVKSDDDEPELFKAASLQEAMTMTTTKVTGGGECEKTRNKQKKEDTNVGGDIFGDDPLALLYPSAAIRAAEEASFEGCRGEIERMIQRQEQEHGDDKNGEQNAGVLQRLKVELQQKEQEYLELHHESTLDGGALKARFKYRNVDPEDFTLSVEEILARDDRQLNMLVPMNCYAAYLTAEANHRDRIRAVKRRGWRRGGHDSTNGGGNEGGFTLGGNSGGGVRVLDAGRRSRRYGDVQRTSLVDATMSEDAGREWAAAVRGGLRRLRDKLDGNEDDGKNDKMEVAGKKQLQQHRRTDGNEHEKRMHAAGAARDMTMKKKPRYEEGGRGESPQRRGGRRKGRGKGRGGGV